MAKIICTFLHSEKCSCKKEAWLELKNRGHRPISRLLVERPDHSVNRLTDNFVQIVDSNIVPFLANIQERKRVNAMNARYYNSEHLPITYSAPIIKSPFQKSSLGSFDNSQVIKSISAPQIRNFHNFEKA